MGDEPSLYEGDLNVDGWVETLQLALRAAGHDPGAIDGKFGWRTAAAVVAFQKDNAFDSQNGVVGNQTWSVLMGREPEPPGVNNGPHGGLYNQPHVAHDDGGGDSIRGAGWEPEHADLTFTSGIGFTSNEIQVELDTQSTGNLVVSVWAELNQNGLLVEQSTRITVDATGLQRIPLQHSYPPGEYDIVVHADDNAGNEISTQAHVTI